MDIKIIIISGGLGTRLWPLSTHNLPKQFIKLFDNLSLFQMAVIRNSPLGKPTIIANENHYALIKDQLNEINIEVDLILEPYQKNTFPCAIIGALLAQKEDKEHVLFIPADHYISDNDAYLATIKKSFIYAQEYNVLTIGVKPSFPHTGYGYIKSSFLITEKIFEADKFVEKPNLSTAQDFIEKDTYYWNSGIFIYNTSFLIETAQTFHRKTYKKIYYSFYNASCFNDYLKIAEEPFCSIESSSFDHKIMEHISSFCLVEANFIWNDLGDWDALWRIQNKNQDNNYFFGNVLATDLRNSYVYSPSKFTALIGLENIVVVDTDEALLVMNKSHSQEVKNLSKYFLYRNSEETINKKVYRPWGYYYVIESRPQHKVKNIVVHPGGRLSLQYHNHRSEHWIILSGIAEIILESNIQTLSEDESIFIPRGFKHRLTNIGNSDLHLIEIQRGHYLKDDDIVRLEDDYGRVSI